MRYTVRFARNSDIDNIQTETVNAKDEQDARDMFTVCDCYIYGVEIVLPPDRDDAAILQAARAIFPNAVLGPQEPPQDYRIYNRRQADGTFPPLSKFFDDAVRKADAETVTDLTRAAYMEAADWMTEARAQMADAKDLQDTQESARI